MASATAIKEELPFIKVEHAECDHGIVEISSSTSSGNDTLLNVESGDGGSRAEGTSPLPTKRRSPDMLTANGIDCAAKRLKADCNGIDLHSSTFLRENPNAGLPDDFLQPLQAIQPNAPLLRQATTATTSSPSLVCPVTDNTNKIFRQFWKAGDYESDKTGQKSTRGGMDHVRVHPKFLHSNATSHKWALGAVAELLDNALDEVVHGATFVKVDMIKNPRNGEPMLLIEDDGGGMNPDCMRQCMSLGYSVKSKMANTIGQYGNGFKTSTMRLGADAIVFSRCPASKGLGPSESVGMLSYTFLRETGQEDIIVPMIDYEIQPFGLRKLIRSNVEDWNRNMETIKRWSPYTTEAELLDHFKGMKKQGTKIIVFNLWEDDQGELELDFLADENDIQLRGVNRDEKLVNLAESFPSARHYLTYQHSLRSYASILYLRLPPGFKMYLRGKEVEHHNLVDDLMYTEVWTYRPVGSDVQVDTGQMKAVVTVGFVKGAEQHIDVQGFNVYHKNRLIKPFWRLWNSAASRGRGIFGVLEANFVEPAHDKQGFERTVVLARLETRLVEMQKTYWSKHCHKVGYVNNALKGNEGRPAGIKGRSSSINAIPPAASGVPRVPGPKPLPSRSTQTQLSPVGSVSFPPAAKSAQGQSRPILSVSSPLPVMSTEAQVSPLLAGSSPSLTRPTLPLRPTQAHVMSGSHPSPARPTLPPRSTQAQLSPVASFPLAARSAQGQVSPGVSPAWARQMQLSPAASGSLSLLAKSAEVQVPSRSPQAHFPPAVTGSLSLATRSTQLPLSPVVSGSLPLPARSTYMPLSPCVSEPFPLSSRSAQMPLSPALSGSTQLHSSPVVSRSLPLPTTSNQVQFSQVAGSLPCMASSSQGQLSEPSCVSVQAAHGCGSYAPSSGSVPVGHSRSTQVGRLEPQLQPGSRIPPMQPVPSSHPMQPAALSPTQPVSADALPQLVPGCQSHMELSALARNWTSRQTDLLSQSQERLQGQYRSATRSALPLPTSSSSGMQSESDRHVVDLGMQLESDRHVIDYASPCLASDQERPAGAGTTENNPRHVMEAFLSPSEAAMAVSQDPSLIKTAGRDTLSLQAGVEVSMSPGASRGSVAAEASSSALITKQLPVKEAGLHGSCGEESGQVSISAEGVTEARSTRETTPPPPRQSSLKASKCCNKSIALGRKSLEDLGRIFAKKAAEVSMNCSERIAPESGPSAGAIVCSTSRSIAAPLDTETHVKELEMEVKPLNTGQITAPEGGPDAGAIVCSTSRSVATPLDMVTHVKELEMEVKLLQQRLEAVTMERDNLKRRLFEERLLGQRSKQELEKKVEETWAKVRALEVQNKHLQHVPH